jgi:aryl-alcohol dehydrogenase-like predicted oxidoreductase
MCSAATNPLLTHRVPLGRTGLSITPLGLGGAWIGRRDRGYDDELAVRTVVRAVELGVNLIDTSPSYQGGESERRIGLALGELERHGRRRSELVICTKAGTRVRPYDYSGEAIRRSLELSLQALRTDYLDIALVHDPRSLEPVLAPGGALDAIAKLKDEGIVRAIGLGVRDHDMHRELIASGRIDVSLVYRDYNLLYQSVRESVLPLAAERGVGVMNGMAVLGGLLGGRNPLDVAGELDAPSGGKGGGIYRTRGTEAQRAHALWSFARERQIPLLALNLQYILREPRIASTLLGAAQADEIEEDVRMALHPLPDGIWEDLSEEVTAPL